MDRLRQLTGARWLKLVEESRAGLVDGDQDTVYIVVLAEERSGSHRKLLVVVAVPAVAWEVGRTQADVKRRRSFCACERGHSRMRQGRISIRQ